MKHSLALLLLFLSISCVKEKNLTVKELHLISVEKISGFDPINASDNYTSAEIAKVYEGLFEFHPLIRPYELIPNLAQTMPQISSDGLSYTIKIKKNVYFHNDPCFKNGIAREMKASDFIYSIKRLADPALQAKGWWAFDDKIKGLNEWRSRPHYGAKVEGLKEIDDYTFQIILKKPFPQLLYALAMPFSFVVPQEAVKTYGKEFLNHPVGTGPFLLKKFEQSNVITYLRNPQFREKYYPSEGSPEDKEQGLLSDAGKKIPMVDKLVVHIMLESQPKWFSFLKAKIDLLEIPKDNFEQAINDGKNLSAELITKGINLVSNPMLDVTYIAFNHDLPLFKNLKLRQAMNLAYDREEANKIFYNNSAVLSHGVVPPGLDGHLPDFKNPYTQYDIQEAKKLLAMAGYPQGKGLPVITVETRNVTVARQMLEHFAKCMSQIGIKIKVGMNTWPDLVNKVTKRQYQMYTMAWGADYPDAENFLGLLYCPNQAPGSNGSNYCNSEFDRYFKQASVLQDSDERTHLYEKMNKLSALDVPWILGFHRTRFYLTQGWLKNFKFMEFNYTQSQYLNVDLEKKKELIPKF